MPSSAAKCGAETTLRREGHPMTQTSNRLLDEVAKLMTDAAGAAQGVKREVEGVMRGQAERILQSMDIVKREEFEAVKAMAEKARGENERLAALVTALEARVAALEATGSR
jgi:BMFP domain-containing protein YqiC